ncbi:carotenoid cleavage dioxygenase 7, chloroplastic isoform X2 [Beta vulgaris subsp. vulgaris]|uniref:carotenoid cleavage dioxygenase 7, chloroplastic isoform X2 n=1 Tax=Beta vulgaris subsp. vulgaris TaxID=3555 RepID=UPI00053FE801|nr:carotenoid cleavage dioxygenase 7, chloroplastic isoform X2 [Beta vulgaris subsp. vulgaris]
MLAKSYHIITPSIFRPSKRSPPPRKIRFRPYATTTQPIPISMPDNRVPTQEVVDDALVALWDYQFLFMSQRLEVPIPIKLKLIEGALPKDFPCGTYYLTGPGLFIDDYGSKIHPLDGHGYLRAFEIDGPNGEVRFSTKYVKTEAQKEECDPISGSWKFTHRGPFSVLKGSKMMSNIKVMKNVANTSILKWGGRLFCLWEGGIPYEIDPQTLDTIGSFNFINDDNDVEDEINFNQSHALDLVARIVKPILHGVFKMPPKRLLSHYKVDAQRRRLIVMACNAEDMVLPRSHYTFYGSMAAICGQAPMISALSVNHSKPTSSIYLLPRFSTNNNSNSQSDDYWRKPIEAPQLWLLHVANAFESIDDNGNLALQIHATACSYQWFNFHKMFGYNWQNDILDPSIMNCKEGKDQTLPHLVEISIKINRNKRSQECSVACIKKQAKSSDFPIINPQCSGYKHRYVYAAASSGSHQTLSHFPFDSILKFDNLTKRVSIWSPGSRRFVGEPMFVSKRSFVEDNGYLLVIEYVASRRMCNLVILDAERVGGVRAVIARLEVPRSLTFPLGFHGTWTPIE